MSTNADLVQYVRAHTVRGTCNCGKCIDRPGVDSQPEGHTADLVFFQVANREGDADTLRKLVEAHAAAPNAHVTLNPLDGREYSYLSLGAWLGDQRLALMLMGLGTLLGLWRLSTPKNMLGLPQELAIELAGSGFVTIRAQGVTPVPGEETESNA